MVGRAGRGGGGAAAGAGVLWRAGLSNAGGGALGCRAGRGGGGAAAGGGCQEVCRVLAGRTGAVAVQGRTEGRLSSRCAVEAQCARSPPASRRSAVPRSGLTGSPGRRHAEGPAAGIRAREVWLYRSAVFCVRVRHARESCGRESVLLQAGEVRRLE
ncbi:hypothetical protein SACE_1441 [Saccharopolyspora erythraea NRRL 2338]|uniref:Uncharacterized protein n=1 Tax=Saccharopolyspora erythraea (strain ATCC 11635 / DSM 40517 / JCM 4748 / NBRC 13426 / NCIMB 8594 / NRRL 2338) TaxID=405948 RepID=A4F9N8_SACEN|nr:hypothetical protein SACE_1441 [Saccharopolyspora erythraea NRRL 2338]